MEYRNLGKSGLKISELSLGSWVTFGNQIADETAEQLMKTAYDAGVNFFDNAESYAQGKSEIVMGKILRKMGWPRDSFVVSSKVFFGVKGLKESMPTQKGLSRKHITEACHQALERLGVDYLDLFFCHRPDRETPIEETVWSMHNLISQGKILYWGTSEWSAQQIMEAHMVARQNNLIGPVMEQPQYNMLHREKVEAEFHRLYQTVGLGTTVWSPLASGVLTGKYSRGKDGKTRMDLPELDWLKEKNLREELLEKAERISALAREVGCSPAQFAIAWCLKNPNVSTVILGASKNTQLVENLKSGECKKLLTAEVMNQVDDILDNKPKLPVF